MRQRIDKTKFRYFDECCTTLWDMPSAEFGHQIHDHAYVRDYAELGLSVAVLNSCEIESHRTDDHKGRIGDAQARALMDYWRSSGQAPALRVLALHHTPVPSPGSALAEWVAYIQ